MCWLAVVQFVLTPVLAAKGFLPRLLSNALYAVACSYYHYLSFLGYSALPFLERTEVSGRLCEALPSCSYCALHCRYALLEAQLSCGRRCQGFAAVRWC